MDVKDLMRAAHENNPTEFETAFNDLMADRVNGQLERRQIEIAQDIGYAETPSNEE